MKKFLLVLIILLLLTACQGKAENLAATQVSIQSTEQAVLFDSLMETAIFETEVVLQLTAMVPTSTLTSTPTITPSATLAPTATPEGRVRNIWALQDECDPYDPRVCIKYTIHNRYIADGNLTITSQKHIHVSLTKTDTKEKGYWVVPPNSVATIFLFPGEYNATYYADCEREDYYYRVWAITERTDRFYCAKDLVYAGVLD